MNGGGLPRGAKIAVAVSAALLSTPARAGEIWLYGTYSTPRRTDPSPTLRPGRDVSSVLAGTHVSSRRGAWDFGLRPFYPRFDSRDAVTWDIAAKHAVQNRSGGFVSVPYGGTRLFPIAGITIRW